MLFTGGHNNSFRLLKHTSPQLDRCCALHKEQLKFSAPGANSFLLFGPCNVTQADAAQAASSPHKKYDQQRRMDWIRLLALLAYTCTLAFYCFIRVTKTLNLGSTGLVGYAWLPTMHAHVPGLVRL